MALKCPILLPGIVFADDAKLAAQVSCLLAQRNGYLPIVDGPRLSRPDREAELIRRNNAAARVKPKIIVFAGLSTGSSSALTRQLNSHEKIIEVSSSEEISRLAEQRVLHFNAQPLRWGRDRIGIGVLRALRAGSSIVFEDTSSPTDYVAPTSTHVVVCEQGNELSEVIAANYAFSLGADLFLIPQVPEEQRTQILEHFYDLYNEANRRGISQSNVIEQLSSELRKLSGAIPIPSPGSATFITGGLPYGVAYPLVPSTHLFEYPNLGCCIINGFAAEQPSARGVCVATLVDPATTCAREIEAAVNILPPRGVFVRVYSGPLADVRSVAEMIELFPYDLLMIATHCGDSSGSRWTYEFTDREGIHRKLVVDVAIGIARTDDEDLFHVTEFTRIISLDGVDWNDPERSKKVYDGYAIEDYAAQTRSPDPELKPVKKEQVPRVEGSAALKMSDHNYIALPRAVAGGGTPIVINNACGSWHRLAETFVFSGARAYVGTLIMVSDSEAHDVVVKLLDKHFGKPLPTALWAAQRDVYGEESIRRPYVMTGVFPQWIRGRRSHVPAYVVRRLSRGLREWEQYLQKTDPNDQPKYRAVKEYIEYYKRELHAFRTKWIRS